MRECFVRCSYKFLFPWTRRTRYGGKTLRQPDSLKTVMQLCGQIRACTIRAFVCGAGIPRGVSEPDWNLLYSDKGCRKLNGTVFYLILKLAWGLDNNFCADICFPFFVYYRAYRHEHVHIYNITRFPSNYAQQRNKCLFSQSLVTCTLTSKFWCRDYLLYYSP